MCVESRAGNDTRSRTSAPWATTESGALVANPRGYAEGTMKCANTWSSGSSERRRARARPRKGARSRRRAGRSRRRATAPGWPKRRVPPTPQTCRLPDMRSPTGPGAMTCTHAPPSASATASLSTKCPAESPGVRGYDVVTIATRFAKARYLRVLAGGLLDVHGVAGGPASILARLRRRRAASLAFLRRFTDGFM